MKYLIQLLVLFLAFQGVAQQWTPKTSYWIYGANHLESGGDLRVSYLKDSLLNGHQCQLLKKDMIEYSYNPKTYSYRLLGKEITYYESGVTYILNDENHFDTLYYFNAKIGDRYKITDRLKGHPTDKAYAVIADTGSMRINIHKLKWQAVDYNFERGSYHYTLRDTIIERIGAAKYYFLPWDEINGMVDGNEGGRLNCYNDVYLVNYNTGNETGCQFDLSLVATKRYEPYIGENKIWKKVQMAWLTGGSEGPNYLVNHSYFNGDTIVDNIRYSKFYNKMEQPSSQKEFLAYLVREDTTSQKVYLNDFRYNKTGLLYDFKLKEGEVFNSYILGGIYHEHTVVKVDTVFLYNRKLKQIVFDDSIKWIEGIGNISGGYIPSSGELICVTDHNLLMYLSPKFNNCDTVFIQGGWDDVKSMEDLAVMVYPQPVTSRSVLKVNSHQYKKLNIRIYSTTGALIKEDDFTDTYPIGSISLKKGLYFYRISFNKQLIKADMIVVH